MDSPREVGRRPLPPVAGVAVGLVLGAALGLTIFENLAAGAGIGLVVGAVVDLIRSRRR